MKNYSFYVDSNTAKYINENGGTITTLPNIVAGSTPALQFTFADSFGISGMIPADLSDATEWQFAGDIDLDHSTNPAIDVPNTEIDSTAAASGIIVVNVDATGERFEEITNGKNTVRMFIELYGIKDDQILYDFQMQANGLGTVKRIFPVPSGDIEP